MPKGQIAWNKGLTKETDERVALIGKSSGRTRIGMVGSFKGKHHSKQSRKKISKKMMGMVHSKERRLNESKGYNHSEQHRLKISIAAAKQAIQNKQDHKWSWGKSGWFYSKKNNKRFRYLSSIELQCLKFLESKEDVLKYQTNPLRILYTYQMQQRNYIPDILVEYNNGKKILIEVKHNKGLKNNIVQIKAKAAIKYCKENNMEYKFYTESKLLM